jgi:hypothetical protein
MGMPSFWRRSPRKRPTVLDTLLDITEHVVTVLAVLLAIWVIDQFQRYLFPPVGYVFFRDTSFRFEAQWLRCWRRCHNRFVLAKKFVHHPLCFEAIMTNALRLMALRFPYLFAVYLAAAVGAALVAFMGFLAVEVLSSLSNVAIPLGLSIATSVAAFVSVVLSAHEWRRYEVVAQRSMGSRYIGRRFTTDQRPHNIGELPRNTGEYAERSWLSRLGPDVAAASFLLPQLLSVLKGNQSGEILIINVPLVIAAIVTANHIRHRRIELQEAGRERREKPNAEGSE